MHWPLLQTLPSQSAASFLPDPRPREVHILVTSTHSMDGESKVTRGSVHISMLCSHSRHSSLAPSGESPALQLRVPGPAQEGQDTSFLLCLILSDPLHLVLVGFPVLTVHTISRHINFCQRPNTHCTKHGSISSGMRLLQSKGTCCLHSI